VGRPRVANPRNVKVTFMMRAAEHEALLRLATAESLDLSSYLRTLVNRAAQGSKSELTANGRKPWTSGKK
jgi:hypothetical protein